VLLNIDSCHAIVEIEADERDNVCTENDTVVSQMYSDEARIMRTHVCNDRDATSSSEVHDALFRRSRRKLLHHVSFNKIGGRHQQERTPEYDRQAA
jgi:hypothetical protein